MLWMILLIPTVVLTIFYLFHISTKNLNHWQKRGVKYVKPVPLFGNILPTITGAKAMTELILEFYNSFPNERYVGVYQFTQPILLIRDPELIKTITIKNFDNFVDHTGFVTSEADVLWTKNLFASQGERWRDLRQTLTPVFTSSKMRTMFALMDECAIQLKNHFKNQTGNIINVELKDLFTRYANDVIATTAFGIKCDSLKNKNNEFFLAGKELADFTGIKKLKFLLYGSWPRLAKFLKIQFVSDSVGTFFRKIIDETIHLREEKNVVRPDLIHLMMLARKGKLKYEEHMSLNKFDFVSIDETKIKRVEYNPNYLSNEDITAQAIVFFLGGYDTVSSLTAFAGYELAINPDVQKKLRQEIAKCHKECDGKITYEHLHGIKYLEMVVSETLRKWGQGVFSDRKCTKTFEIEPEKQGEKLLKINVGDVCWIPAYGLHMDPKYFPNPEVFDPERFSDENAHKIQPGTYMPFGTGPRNCIGSRFAILETKILLYHLLLDFEFVPTDKTEIPVRLRTDTVSVLPQNGFHVGFKRAPIY